MRVTVKELKEILDTFPETLTVSNEISLFWTFPDNLREKQEQLSEEDYLYLTRMNATELCLFEGSWEEDTIVDREEILKKYL